MLIQINKNKGFAWLPVLIVLVIIIVAVTFWFKNSKTNQTSIEAPIDQPFADTTGMKVAILPWRKKVQIFDNPITTLTLVAVNSARAVVAVGSADTDDLSEQTLRIGEKHFFHDCASGVGVDVVLVKIQLSEVTVNVAPDTNYSCANE